jgi:PAS domain S-box-containing protein
MNRRLFINMPSEHLSSHFTQNFGLEERDLIRIWVIAAFVMVSVLVTFSAFTFPFEDLYPPLLFLFPQLYYIPIILISVWYPRYGLQATVLLVAAFLGITSYYYFQGTTPIGPFITGLNAAMYLWVVLATTSLAHEGGLLKYLNIFRNMDAGIFLCSRDSGLILDVNDRFAELMGYQPSKLMGLPAVELWERKGDGEAFFTEFEASGAIRDRKVRFLGKSGEIKVIRLSCRHARYQPAVQCTAVDITAEEKETENLIQAKERLHTLIASSQDLIFMQDLSGTFVQFYWARGPLYGVNPVEVAGKTPYELFSRQTAEEVTRYRKSVSTSGETVNFSFSEHFGNSEHRFSMIIGPVRDESGKVIGTIGTMHDITGQSPEEYSVMQLERELDRWRNFINIAAHELRTPLQPILGYLHLILEDPSSFALDSETVKLLRLCLENVERERRVVDRMLELGMMDSAKVHLDITEFPLRQFVQTVNRIGGYEQNAEFEINIPPDVTIRADRDCLFQVLDGLISNAVRYSKPPRHVRISHAEDTDHHLIRVADNGAGIAEEALESIFEPFYLADREKLSREYGRIGLGLSIARKYVQMHGGSIEVESTVGSGSTFTVRLPKEVAS